MVIIVQTGMVEALEAHRRVSGMTQTEFSAHFGYRQNWWSRVCSRQRGLTPEVLSRIVNLWPLPHPLGQMAMEQFLELGKNLSPGSAHGHHP